MATQYLIPGRAMVSRGQSDWYKSKVDGNLQFLSRWGAWLQKLVEFVCCTLRDGGDRAQAEPEVRRWAVGG